MPTEVYTQHFRNLAATHRGILAGDTNARKLGDQLGVSDRTVQRYIVFLRELGAPITFDASTNVYRYDRKWSFGKALLAWLDAD